MPSLSEARARDVQACDPSGVSGSSLLATCSDPPCGAAAERGDHPERRPESRLRLLRACSRKTLENGRIHGACPWTEPFDWAAERGNKARSKTTGRKKGQSINQASILRRDVVLQNKASDRYRKMLATRGRGGRHDPRRPEGCNEYWWHLRPCYALRSRGQHPPINPIDVASPTIARRRAPAQTKTPIFASESSA